MRFANLAWFVAAMLLPARAGASVATTTESSLGTAFSSTAWASKVSSTDLINSGRATYSSATVGTTYSGFPVTGLNDGTSTDLATSGNTFFTVASPACFTGPAGTVTATFDLNVSANTSGYDITSIQSFMGWSTVSRIQANQTYTVSVRQVGSSSYTDIATVNYLPFTDIVGTNYESHVTITENSSGILATGVDSIRFTFLNPLNSVANSTGGTEGTLVRELDVYGYPTGGVPDTTTVAVSKPMSRSIVQRTPSNTGSIPVTGSYAGSPSRIEARAVVMAGNNSGTTTDWTEIVSAPSGGTFTGTLNGVPAGGWYQLEVRSVTGGVPGEVASVQKVGVGDIYVTCGQSNSANHGSGGYTVSDDRVSAWNYANGTWSKASDPMPGASGTGGSVWTRLGDLLAARDNIPVAFACVGVGGTQISQWIPPGGNYPRIKAAVQAFPANGFRAVLWHQGESDAIAATTAATYRSRMESIIAQSRIDAGWQVPWYLAEASFHPSSTLAAEEPIVAGQRAMIHGDPLVFFGPSTDELHLEDANGGKLADSVHFNTAGLLDHATQWRDILRGSPTLTPRNANFEDNRTPAITGLSPLADGASHIVTPTTNTDSPSVLGWRILSAFGTIAADGNNGFHNPASGTFAAAADTNNGGVMLNMAGKHVAVLDGGSPGNYFLHSTRALAAPSTHYTLTVALGVRDIPTTFGNARLEITAKGIVVASQTFNKTVLDNLRGGNCTGTFTDASITWNTGTTVAANQPLAIRIIKEGGAGAVLDFDNVRFTSEPIPKFSSWIGDPAFGIDPAQQGFAHDPDGDGLPNSIEAWFGTRPGETFAGLSALSTDGRTTTFTHPQNPNPPSDLTGTYEWSPNLADWFIGDGQHGPPGGPTVTITPSTSGGTTTVTAVSSQPAPRIFLRACVAWLQ